MIEQKEGEAMEAAKPPSVIGKEGGGGGGGGGGGEQADAQVKGF